MGEGISAHFKGFGGLAWAHVGPRWLKIALNHLFELRKWSKNNLGKNHIRPLLDPQVTP